MCEKQGSEQCIACITIYFKKGLCPYMHRSSKEGHPEQQPWREEEA